jgi:Tat protein secretion system quality control protein TatD with DNase activity
MKEHVPKEWRVHVHCFTSSLDMAKSLLDEWPNLFIGYTGVRFLHLFLLPQTKTVTIVGIL